jgi:hypothetical protein
MLILAVIVSWTACEEKETTFLTVEPAQIDLDGESSSRLIKIISNEDWTIDLGNTDWIRVDQTTGEGDGNMRLIDVSIDQNTEAIRTGHITVRAGSEVKIVTINQYSATFGTPVLSRQVTANFPLTGVLLRVPYSGFLGNESFKISVRAEGASKGGIDEISDFPVTLDAPEGIIEIPLSGVPTTPGIANLMVTTDYPGYSITPASMRINKLSFGEASLSGNFETAKDVSDKEILIPYSGASGLGLESFTVSVALSGPGAEGIDPVTEHEVTLDAASSGMFSIPLSGTPSASGNITFMFNLSIPGTSIGKFEASVYSKIYADMNFNLMLLGGDAVGVLSGIILDTSVTPWDITTDPGKVNLPANPVYKSCSYTTLATNFFGTGAGKVDGNGTISDIYKTKRGFTGNWTGANIFEQPGYVMFGYSAANGLLQTPPLSDIAGTKDVRVSFRAARTGDAGTAVKVTVNGGGSILGGTDTFTFPLNNLREWEPKSFTIAGATPATTIQFTNAVSEAGKRNFGFDDLLIIETN